jgi:hypothetical protein
MTTKLPPPMISTTCKETYPSFLSEMQAPESIIEFSYLTDQDAIP